MIIYGETNNFGYNLQPITAKPSPPTRHMKIILLFLSLIWVPHSFAQIRVTSLDNHTVPQNIRYAGKLVRAVRWADQTGDQIVILSDTSPYPTKDTVEEGNDEEIFASHFQISGDHSILTWRVCDFEKACDLDMDFYFVNDAFAVTDLNQEGKAEVWIMYRNSCHGDVSPVPMKIIMYEDGHKYAVRGTTRVRVSATDFMGGGPINSTMLSEGALRSSGNMLPNSGKPTKWRPEIINPPQKKIDMRMTARKAWMPEGRTRFIPPGVIYLE